jgi:hypothetical protein
MFAALTAVEAPFRQSSSEAAAVAVLAITPPPLPPDRPDPAPRAVAPHLADAGRTASAAVSAGRLRCCQARR